MNVELFKFYMALNGDNGKTLAEALGIHETTLSNKLNNNGTSFNLNELNVIRDRYQIKPHAFYAIFFNIKGEEFSTSVSVG